MLAETISAELSRAIAHGIAAGAHVGRKMPLDVILDAVDAYTAQEPKSAPELADAIAERDKARADRNRARNAACNLLDLFGAPDERLMQHASVTGATLRRYATDAGVRLDGQAST